MTDAKVLGENTEEEIREFVEKYITCRLPSATASPLLAKLVKDYQMHIKCTDSCRRFIFQKNKTRVICRYGYPRKVTNRFILNSVEKAARSRASGGAVVKLYSLKRTEAEMFVNDYNPALLLMWQANMDLQYIGENSLVLNRYVTSYISKAEKSATEDTWRAIDENRSLASRLKSFALRSLTDREIGAYEASDRLLGNHLYEKSATVQYLGVGYASQRRRRFLSCDELQQLAPHSSDIYYPNWIDSYYPNRPMQSENMCLFELFVNYEHKTDTNRASSTLPLWKNLGYLWKRKKPILARTPNVRPTDPEKKELYFHNLLMLFLPWRVEEEHILGNWPSYEVAFNFHSPDLPDMNAFRAAKERLQAAQELADQLREQRLPGGEEDADNDEEWDADMAPQEMETAFPRREVDTERLNDTIANLNDQQKAIFDSITDEIAHQEKHRLNDCPCAGAEQILKFISGGAGNLSFSFQCKKLLTDHRYRENMHQTYFSTKMQPKTNSPSSPDRSQRPCLLMCNSDIDDRKGEKLFLNHKRGPAFSIQLKIICIF